MLKKLLSIVLVLSFLGANSAYSTFASVSLPPDRPKPSILFPGFTAEKIEANRLNGLALREDGTIWVWGNSEYGQFGYVTSNSIVPVKVEADGMPEFKEASMGFKHVLALSEEGKVWAWGQNYYGQLGKGTESSGLAPTEISALADITVKQAEAGFSHSLILTEDGEVYSFGDNSFGQIGDGTYIQRNLPYLISDLTDIIQVSACNHNLALKSDGTVWSWGRNAQGNLGNGTKEDNPLPMQVEGLPFIVKVIARDYGSFAIDEDGNIWSWGHTSLLGTGNRIEALVPVQLSGITDVVDIISGEDHAFAIQSDGTVWGWGYTKTGQLGRVQENWIGSPLQLEEFTGINEFACAGYFSYFIANGTIVCCGQNYKTLLGVNDSEYYKSEVVDFDDDGLLFYQGELGEYDIDWYAFKAQSTKSGNGYMDFKVDIQMEDTTDIVKFALFEPEFKVVKNSEGQPIQDFDQLELYLEHDKTYYIAVYRKTEDLAGSIGYKLNITPNYDRDHIEPMIDFSNSEYKFTLPETNVTYYLYDSKFKNEMTIAKDVKANNSTFEVEDASSFKVGQGIALKGMERVSDKDGEKQYTYFTSIITEITPTTGKKANITIYAISDKIKLPAMDATDVTVEHDNYWPLYIIFEYYSKENRFKDISALFPKNGLFEIKGANIYVPKPSDKNNFAYEDTDHTYTFGFANSEQRFVIILNNKDSVYLDFNGSQFKFIMDYYAGGDYYNKDPKKSSRKKSIVRPYSFVKVCNSKNVTIKNLNVDTTMEENYIRDPSIYQGYASAIRLAGIKKASLYNLDLRHMDQDGISISQYQITDNKDVITARIGCEDIRIKNYFSFRNGRQGISLNSVDGYKMTDCDIVETGRAKGFKDGEYLGFLPGAGIDYEVEPTAVGDKLDNILMKNCSFVDNMGGAVQWYISPSLNEPTQSQNVIFENNLFYNSDEISKDPLVRSSDSPLGFSGITYRNNMFVVNPRITQPVMDTPRLTIKQARIKDDDSNPQFIYENNVFLGDINIRTFSNSDYPDEVNVDYMAKYKNNAFLVEDGGKFYTDFDVDRRKPFSTTFEGNFFYFSKKCISNNKEPFLAGLIFKPLENQGETKKNIIYNTNTNVNLTMNGFSMINNKSGINVQSYNVLDGVKFFGKFELNNLNLNGFSSPSNYTSFELSTGINTTIKQAFINNISEIPSEKIYYETLYEDLKQQAIQRISDLGDRLIVRSYVIKPYTDTKSLQSGNLITTDEIHTWGIGTELE